MQRAARSLRAALVVGLLAAFGVMVGTRVAAERAVTTVRVVAPETPSAVGGASYPSKVAITVTAMPNTIDFTRPFKTSYRKSTAACICDQKAPLSTPISTTPMPGTSLRISGRFSIPRMSSIMMIARISPLGLSGHTSARS